MSGSVFFKEQAERCRRLARETTDSLTRDRLLKLAEEYEIQAESAHHNSQGDPPAGPGAEG